MGDAVRNRKIEQLGWKGWRESNAKIARGWDLIETTLWSRVPKVLTRVRIYQDSLAISGREIAIVEELAAKGSRNFRLIKELVARGATLVGTEDPRLLIKHLHAVKASYLGQRFQEGGLMRERDEFIGTRINATLLDDETGLLFLGQLHSVGAFLAPDIVQQFPLEENRSSHG